MSCYGSVFQKFLLISHRSLVLTHRGHGWLLWRINLAQTKLISPGPAAFQPPYISEVVLSGSVSSDSFLPGIPVHSSMENFRK